MCCFFLEVLEIITSNQGFAARMVNKSDACNVYIKSAGVTSAPRVVVDLTGLLP